MTTPATMAEAIGRGIRGGRAVDPNTTDDGEPLVVRYPDRPPLVRCTCGATSWTVGETSFVYQRCQIDTAADEPEPIDYDSGDIESAYARSTDFARCADCGREPIGPAVDALREYWCGPGPEMPDALRDLAEAADALAQRFADRGDGSLVSLTADHLDALDALGDALVPFHRWRDEAAQAAAKYNPEAAAAMTVGRIIPA